MYIKLLMVFLSVLVVGFLLLGGAEHGNRYTYVC